MKPTLYLIRGLPGSGKSTLADRMAWAMPAERVEADQFMQDEAGIYKFDPDKLMYAHSRCRVVTREALEQGVSVIVSNTSTTEKEVEVYSRIANDYGANFVSIVVENRHGNESVHDVPAETMQKMKNRFSIKL